MRAVAGRRHIDRPDVRPSRMPKPSRGSLTPIQPSLFVLAGCVASGPLPPSVPAVAASSSAGAPSTVTPSGPPASVSPSAPAAPTPSPLLNLADLPKSRTDGSTTLVVCDPEPGAGLSDDVEQLISCGDGIDAGLRAIESVTGDAFSRVYLDLPTCTQAPCTPEQLGTGTVTAWSGDRAWSTTIDARTPAWTASAPLSVDAAPWPVADGPAASGAAPAIDGAPAEIANRKALPFCGKAEMGEPPAVGRCFLAAVLAGRPAEMFDLQHGTEGGSSLLIARFGGVGPVVVYQQHLDDQGRTGSWFRQLSAVILGPDGISWNADPLSNTLRDLL